MAVGRITGPLLASNLLRDGVNLAVETNLLYLDVTTGRIGIKTASPQYDLDVNGTANIGNLIVQNTSTLGLITITKTASSGTIGSTLGPIHVKPAIGNDIRLDADTTVDGNLHATGNITADGNIVLGNQLGVDTLTIGAEFLSDIIPKTPNTYNVGSQINNWNQGYFNQIQANNVKIYGSTITNLLPIQGLDIAPKGGPLNVYGEIRIWGQNPLGTAPVTANILYVNEDGSDTNDGGAMDPSRACRTVSGATKSPLYKEGTSIKVAPGHYRENNPILMKQYTSVIGSDLRTTIIEPLNKTQDLFHVQSGCYVAQLMTYNGRSGRFPGGSGYAPGTNRGAYATAFPPQVNGAKIDLFHSPYIQNVTNQSGPWLYDGTMFVPNQTIQVPEAIGTATYPANTTTFTVTLSTGSIYIGQSINGGPPNIGFQNARTLLLANKAFIQEQTIAYVDQTFGGPFQYNSAKCSRDTGLIVDGLGLDLIYNGTSQSVFAGLQYWSQSGYTGQIASEVTTTTNTFNYISTLAQQIVRNILTTHYQNTITQVTNLPAGAIVDSTRVASLFTTATNVITYGTVGITDKIISNGTAISTSTSTVAAFNLLEANKGFLQAEAIAYITATAPTFNYSASKCKRDVGYLVDCVAFDLLRGGNRQSIQAGTVYYGYTNTTQLPNEIAQTTLAYQYMKSVISAVVQSQQLVSFYQSNVSQVLDSVNPGSAVAAATISTNIDLITRLINVGPAGAPSLVPIGLTQSADTGLLNAYALLNKNKAFIVAEVIAYTSSLPNFVYNQEKCKRDVGIILENVSFDSLVGGNSKAVESGLAYFNGVNSVIAGQETQSVAAINWVSSLTNSIINNMAAPNLLGSTATQQQVINYAFPGGSIAQTSLDNGFQTITDIINNGPSSAPKSFPGCAPDPYYMAAEILLQENRSFIQEEVVTYLNQQFLTFPFNTAKCYRDSGLIVDSIALDMLFPTATDSQSNFAGLQYYSQSNYTGLIASEITTTTNAVTYLSSLAQKIILNDTSGPRYQNAVVQDNSVASSDADTATSIGTNFNIILDILNNGTVGITDKIVPSGLASTAPPIVHAYTQLQNNKAYLQAEVVAYVESTKTPGFVYDQSKCLRDVGYMVDSISFDCLYGGNRQSVMAGVDYYSHNASSSVQTPSETTATIAAYTHLNAIIGGIIKATPVPRSASNLMEQVINLPPATDTEVTLAQAKITKITNIVSNGPSAASALTPISLTPSTNANIQRAYDLLEANRDFIANELVQYAQNTYNGGGFQYNQTKCSRDTGLLVDGFITDLGWSTNGYTNTQFAGLQYWNQSGYTGQIGRELSTTTAAINYVSSLAQKLVTNDASAPRYQNTLTQIINLPAATAAEATALQNEFKIITDILSTGTVGITDKVISNGLVITSANAQNAYDILQANKSYLQAEAIAFVETTKTQSFVYNQDKCFRDTGLIVDTICQDLMFATTSSQATFAGLQYWAQTSTSIPGEVTTTTNAINYVSALAQKIIVGDGTGTRYQSAVAQTTSTSLAYGTAVEQSTLSSEFNLITDIITNGVVNLTNRIVPNGYVSSTVATTLNAYNLLVANLTYLQAEAVAYVESTKTAGFTYDQTTCRRDIGYMVTSVAFDLLWGGNKQAIQSGAYYYNYSASTSTIPTEKPQTLAAYNYLKTLVGNIVTNTAITPSKGNTAIQYTNAEPATVAEVTALQASISTITNIITNGPSVAATKLPISLTPSTNIAVGNAVDLLQANRQFIQQELVAWINENYGDFTYDLAKCKRDVGYMIDSVSYDLLWGGNRQAITSGVYYYTFDGNSTAIPGESQQVQAAYQRLGGILGDIITNTPIAVSPGNLTPQAFNSSPAIIETAALLNEMVDLLLNIINNGPSAAGPKLPIGLVQNTDTNIVRAQVLLTLNRQFIRDEIIAYINISFPNYQGNNGFNYDQAKCYRDTGLIIDAISQDLLVGGNRKTIEAGVSYWTGGTNVVYNELPQFNAALAYIKSLANQIVQNQTVTSLSGAPQVINTYFGGGQYAITNINRLVDTFTTIVTKGPEFTPIGYEGSGAFSALSPTSADVTQVASTVLQADRVGVNEYQITLNVPTQGPGINQTIYFGQTSVYPLQDKDVPDIYSDRKVDPWGSIGGSLVDGGVISDRSPIQSFVYDAFTQVNQGGIGIHITNNGYAQLVSVFTIFCGTSVLVENGGICSITNSNANFGDYCLVSKGYGKRSFFGEVTNPPVLPYYPNGYFPQAQQVEVYCPDPANRPHIGQIMEVEVPETYRNSQGLPGFLSAIVSTGTLTTGSITINGIDTTGIVIGQSLYVRDQYGSYDDLFGNQYITTGTVVTDVNFKSISLSKPINAGGGDAANPNYFTMYVTGNAYYTIRGSTPAPDPIAPGTKLIGASVTAQGNNQTIEEIQAINYLSSLTNSVVANKLINAYQSTITQFTNIALATGGQSTVRMGQLFTTLENIINNGPSAVPTISTTGIVAPGASDASALLSSNKPFLQAEIVSYINNLYFVYDHATCKRDLGYILDGFAYDVAFQSNYQAIKCGQAYNRNVSQYVLNFEKTQTVDAVGKLSAITNQLAGISTVTSAISVVNLDSIYIQNIINGGDGAGPAYSMPAPAGLDSGIVGAISLINNNRSFIIEELIGWINSTYPVFTYDQIKCKRDMGYVLDAIHWDLLLGTNYRSVKAGNAYYRGNAGNVLSNEKPETIAAFNFIRDNSLILPAVSASTTATTVLNTGIATIENILQNGVSVAPAVTYTLPSNISTGFASASLLLQNNIAFIQAEVEAYVYTTYTAGGFTYDRAKCKRDVGYLIQAIIYDITYGGNSMSVDAALVYFDEANNNVSVIPNEQSQTVAAINYINTLCQRIVTNQNVLVSYQTSNIVTQYKNNSYVNGVNAAPTIAILVTEMSNIVGNGVGSAPVVTTPDISWVDSSIVAAATAINTNANSVASQAITYINQNYTVFTYNQASCRRDAGYIIEALLYDLTYGGNWQTVDSGTLYWNGNVSLIPGEISQTADAWNYLLYLMSQIVQNQNPTHSYQAIYSQFTNGSITNGGNAIPTLTTLVGYLTRIVQYGTGYAPTIEYPSISQATPVLQGIYNIIQTQKNNLINQVISYIDSKYNGFEYNQSLCKRDVGYIIDAIAADLTSGGNYNTVLAGQSYYARAGTHHYVELEDNITDATLFPDKALVNFYQRSYMSASGYLFEYVGAGSNYGALPQVGRADPIQERETIQLNNGKVFFTSTDQNGDFRIGPGLVISQATGVLSGRTFTKSLFANLTPFILAIEGI